MDNYISEEHTKMVYAELKWEQKNLQNDWETAVKIFEDRIQRRYFSAITALRRKKIDSTEKSERRWRHGFAVMAINCLLIETFCQFEDGVKGNEKEETRKRHYIAFLKKHFEDFKEHEAFVFYADVRCGILHSGQTKKGSYLTYSNDNKDKIISFSELERGKKEEKEPDKGVKVNVPRLVKELKKWFRNYCKKLRNGDEELRKNFRKKMNYICDVKDKDEAQ